MVSVAVTVTVGVPAAVNVWLALAAVVARDSMALPSPQLTLNLERLEPAAALALRLSVYETPVFAVAAPEAVTVGSDKLTVTP